MIEVENLVVVYPDGTRAVDDISFAVREGEFFGFLGPNGAGKSTTIKALTTILRKRSGSVRVAGFDMDRSGRDIRRSIGVLSQETTLDVDLTARENVRFIGRLQDMRGPSLDARVDELLTLVDLSDVADKPAGRFSGGMRKRLDLASALVHRPKLLFLDEPTTGLDPQSRAGLWDYLRRLNRDEHVTIFLTTQYMEEADRLCQRLSIIDKGKLIGGGSPKDLKESLGGDTLRLELDPEGGPGLVSRTLGVLRGIPGLSAVAESDGGVVASAPNASQRVADIVTALAREDIKPTSVSVNSATLDDVFLRLTGRKIRGEELGRKTTEPFMM